MIYAFSMVKNNADRRDQFRGHDPNFVRGHKGRIYNRYLRFRLL